MIPIRNIGIFAHVDAGKTTLTERMLAHAGAIRSPGSVDAGTAHTDRLDIERARGISVKATCARLNWRGVTVQLIDTPGHADFAAEVERALWALDGAVLLLSAADGVQPQAETLFEALTAQRIPTLIFLNKLDREGADPRAALEQVKRTLTPRAAFLEDSEALMELLAELDEQAFSDYVAGCVYSPERLEQVLRPHVHACRAFPVLSGSALKDQGVEALLDGVVSLLPSPTGDPSGPLCGVVFALEQQRAMGRAAHVRLFSGRLSNRDALEFDGPAGPDGAPVRTQHKVSQIRSLDAAGRGEDLGALTAGQIGAVYGLGGVAVGQVLGEAALLPRRVEPGRLRAPLIMVQALPERPEQMNALRQALGELTAEDPLLDVQWSGAVRQLHIRVMGAIQLEVLADQLRRRYELGVQFGPPAVIYRETIARPSVGFVAYTMPKPCWAVLKFQIDPLPRGSGVVFESQVPVRDIMERYQNQVQKALPLALKQGMLGWQVTDVKITLIDGSHHLIHTHPLDFIVATPMGILDGLRRGGSQLLEPVLSVRFSVPERCGGRLMSDIVAMRGSVERSELRGDTLHLVAQVPVSTSLNYPMELAQFTGGRGALSAQLAGYRDCPLELGATAPRRGVDPLDTAKYILAARSALEGGIFDL